MDTTENNNNRFAAVKVEVAKDVDHETLHYYDTDVEGVYLMAFNHPVEREMMNTVALDVFHSVTPIKVLDDFTFQVLTLENEPVEVLEDEFDFDPYTFSESGEIVTKVTLNEWADRFSDKNNANPGLKL